MHRSPRTVGIRRPGRRRALEARRVPFDEVGSITYPARVAESYADTLLANLDAEAIGERHYRIVVDFGGSAASNVLPLVLGPLGVESVAAHPFASDSATRPLPNGSVRPPPTVVDSFGPRDR